MKKHRGFTRKILTLILCLSVFQTILPTISAQTKRGKSAPKPVKTADKTSPVTSDFLISANSNQALSAVWKSGELPQPLALPSGNSDQTAAILAQKILARNNESVSALMTALQFAGFFITDKTGKILLAPPDGKGLGLTINGWEIASAAKMLGEGKKTSVQNLNNGLKSIPYFSQHENIASLMLEDIRNNAGNSRNQFVKNFSRLIIELGKNKTDAAKQTEETEINAVQHLLMMRRLYGDLWARAERWKMRTGTAQTENRGEVRFSKMSFSTSEKQNSYLEILNENPLKFNFQSVSEDTPQQQIPCRMDGNAPTVMDAGATVSSETYGKILDLLEDLYEDTPTGTALQKFAMYQSIANTLLAYAKFVQTYAALETKIILEDAPPLIRTKNTIPGARKPLRAEVRMNIGNWQMYNCVRLAINVTLGVDFATVNDGPIGDVGVTWHLDEGGARDRYSNSTGLDNSAEQIVGITQDGKRIQDAGTGTREIGKANYTKTDDKGIARVILEGSPQRNAKIGRVSEVSKQAVVRTTIKMKAGEIKGDMVDVIGQALGGVGGLLTMPAELIYRSDWASTADLTVPVIDWEECSGGWNGTITITRKRKDSSEVKNQKGVRTTTDFARTSFDESYTATVKIENARAVSTNGVNGQNKQFNAGFIPIKADTIVSSKIVRADEKQSFYYDNCGQLTTKRVLYEKNSDETSGDAATEAEGNIFIDPMQIRFTIQLRIGGIAAKNTRINTRETRGYCDPLDNKMTDTTSEATEEINWSAIDIDDGTLDPNRPQLIEGSKSFTDSLGSEIEIRWSLRHCS